MSTKKILTKFIEGEKKEKKERNDREIKFLDYMLDGGKETFTTGNIFKLFVIAKNVF